MEERLKAVQFPLLPFCMTIPMIDDLLAEFIRLNADKRTSWHNMVFGSRGSRSEMFVVMVVFVVKHVKAQMRQSV
jgi:hypothetical protein